MIRSAVAVLAGIVVLTATSFAIEAVLNPSLPRTFPNGWLKALTFTYGLLCVAAGGYVTAFIARRWPMRHALAMGLVQAGLTIMAMLSPVANHASTAQWVMTAILSVPTAMLGGVVYQSWNRRKPLKGIA